MHEDWADRMSRITRDYWDYREGHGTDEAVKWYITKGQAALDGKSLLEAELEWAIQRGNITSRPCETLVLLVGFSLDPLLQSICVYKPKKVVLLLNEDGYVGEQWHVFARHVTEAVEHLKRKGLLEHLPLFPPKLPSGGGQSKAGYPVKSSPEAIFEKLVEVLQDEKDVVIDVTGGKKSMVTGAYLYAAYSGVPISYVDFDKYDPKRRQPYGFSCKIGELKNPYDKFALRDWEQVRLLYSRYKFHEASETLNRILPLMQQTLPSSDPAVSLLAQFMEYYGLWDAGDFRGAEQKAHIIEQVSGTTFCQPTAVSELGPIWFQAETDRPEFRSRPDKFFGQKDKVRVYACDELARIWRLIVYKEDYRSAFLRAGGLSEILMLVRLVDKIEDPHDREQFLEKLERDDTPRAKVAYKELLNSDRISMKALRFRDPPNLPDIPNVPRMNRWWNSTSLFGDRSDKYGCDVFLDIRNKLAHTYLSVPREWAEGALEYVRANLNDLFEQPAHLETEAMSWPDLCGLCGMDQFLPPKLREEVQL